MTMMMTTATMNVHMNISVILVVNRFPSKGVFMKQVFASKVEKSRSTLWLLVCWFEVHAPWLKRGSSDPPELIHYGWPFCIQEGKGCPGHQLRRLEAGPEGRLARIQLIAFDCWNLSLPCWQPGLDCKIKFGQMGLVYSQTALLPHAKTWLQWRPLQCDDRNLWQEAAVVQQRTKYCEQRCLIPNIAGGWSFVLFHDSGPRTRK